MPTQPPYWVDISGILGIQRALLNNNVNDTNFDKLDVAVNLANNNILPTLTYQKEVLGIVNRENDRLQKRKRIIDDAYMGQRRMVELTDSVTAKNQAYNYMLFIVVLIIFVYLGIKMLKSMEIVPQFVLEILNIIIISLGIIYCIYLYIDIKRRYNMDFNQVTLIEPPSKSQDQINKDMDANVKSGNLLGIAGTQGSCQPDHTYNAQYKICVPNAPPAFKPDNSASQYTTDFKYFANDDGTFQWKNVALPTPGASATLSATTGCGGVDKYDFASLGCKTNGFRNINAVKTSADANAFTADEFANYGKY
jgi:hypothetical protein